MAEMNKRPSSTISDSREALEAELIGNSCSRMKLDIEKGRSTSIQNDAKMASALSMNKHFNIKQGLRRKHPERTLHQFQGIQGTQTRAAHSWEAAFQYENERVQMPTEFALSGTDRGMITDPGINKISSMNYRNAQHKLSDMHLTAV